MKIIIGDILSFVNDSNIAICVPTNGITNKFGKAVMGAGFAKLIRDTYVGCDEVLGSLLCKKSHIVQQFWQEPNLISFPTKIHWKDNSSLGLIEKSCKELVLLQNKKQFKEIFLVPPGIGKGNLSWVDVKVILEKYLIGDFYIVVAKEKIV